MSVSVLNQFVDFQMLLAISKEPNSAAITANLFRMVSLAKNDPEGCVRIAPGRGMTSKELAEVFHCSTESMNHSIEMMKKYGIVTGNDGQYFILSLRKKKGRATWKTLRETTTETIRENHNYNNYYLYNNKNNKKIIMIMAQRTTRKRTEPHRIRNRSATVSPSFPGNIRKQIPIR